ncbi:MAG: TolC family protein [Deltaproteobacteria bacterium]|nr:TolC family protein [Deltaproteobacteria bacterium]
MAILLLGVPSARAQLGSTEAPSSFATSSSSSAAASPAATRVQASPGIAGDAQGLLGLKEPAGGRKTLSLDDALKQAMGTAPDSRIALERVVQQQAQLRRAWASLLPTLTTGVAYTHNCTGGEDGIDCADRSQNLVNQEQIDQQSLLFQSLADIAGIAADAAGNPDDEASFRAQQADLQKAADDIKNTDTQTVVVQPASQFSGQVTLNLPLFNPRAYPGLMSAYDSVDVSRIAEQQARQGLALSVVRAYYAAFTAQRLVTATEHQVEATTRQRDAVKVRVEASTVPLLSLKRAELELLRARQSLGQARAASDNAVAVLGTALGVDEMFTLVEPSIPEGIDPADATTLVDRAFEQRLELKTQRIVVAIAERGTVDAWMQFLPQVGLSATARATSFTQGFVRDPVTGTLTLSATLPLYDGGLRYASMHESSSKTSEERVRLQQLQDRVAAQVRGNLRDVAVREEALVLSRQSLEVAKDAQAQAQALFDAGVGTALDLSDTGFAVFVAETDTLRAELDVASARLGLRWAIGNVLY